MTDDKNGSRDDGFSALKNIEADEKDNEIAALQNQLTDEKDGRLEDRFIFVLVIIIIIDVFTFSSFETWGSPIAILFLQVVLLIVLGQRCGNEEVQKLIDRATALMLGRGKE